MCPALKNANPPRRTIFPAEPPVCQNGNENVCPSKVRLGNDINGDFAEEVSVPIDYGWPLQDELNAEVAVFVEPLAVTMLQHLVGKLFFLVFRGRHIPSFRI